MAAVSVITGGAGGIGLATAKIVGRDHRVVICDVSQDRLDTAVAELKSHDIDCTAAVCDITDQKSVAALVDIALSLGTLASLIHTAGFSPSMGSPERIMQINALGTVNVNEAFYRQAQDGFASVNVASMAAYLVPRVFVPKSRFKHALADQAAFLDKMMSACKLAPKSMRPGLSYSISKSFVIWYCATQAARFGTEGARILSVSPGSIDTDMGRLEEQRGAGAMLRHAALKRFGRPEEVAELLAFCASDKASYLTGIDIPCDGGVTGSVSLRDKLSIARKPS